MTATHDMRDALVAAIPNLRAFAISLCGDKTAANDLVQETLLKAWANQASFLPGSNLKAWLFTILRNSFYSERRKAKQEVQDVNGAAAERLVSIPEQHGQLDLKDFRAAMAKLSQDQREILILVGAEGLTYEEAAEICGCAVGTVKSRLNRARARLATLMNLDSAGDLGGSAEDQAVSAGSSAAWLR